MRINIHAGHNPDGKVACGAVGYIKESTEARRVKDKVIALLKSDGHIVYDCTCEDGTSQANVLTKILAKCNAHPVDLDVSIHFNALVKSAKDGKTKGTEVLVYSKTSKAIPKAEAVCNAITKSLGITNRGIKVRSDLAFLKKAQSPSMLIECLFVDDADDVAKYDADKLANAIVEGITGKKVETKPFTDFVVTITANVLNVRKKPTTDSAIFMRVFKGQKYTIVGIENGEWGKLKSGAGYINLKHTSR